MNAETEQTPFSLFSEEEAPRTADVAKSAFAGLLGQDKACEVLCSAILKDRVPHAYLFVGPEGVGKRTAARLWAKALNCQNPRSPIAACDACVACKKIDADNHPDVMWVNFDFQAQVLEEDAAKQKSIKIDTIRHVERALQFKSSEGKVKVAVIDPADALVEVAAHALLKILEEPPPKTHLILLTRDPSQILLTLRSRCQWVRFNPLSQEHMRQVLEKTQKHETVDNIAKAVAQSEGSLSRAEQYLSAPPDEAFEWDSCPVSELLYFCDQHRNTQEGRDDAALFLQSLLRKYRGAAGAAAESQAALARVLRALADLRHNVNPALILTVLLLELRREQKRKAS
jgi:DNA polymerase-3 subunit delta'